MTKTLINHLTKITNAPNVETAWALHCARMQDFGFDRLLYGFTHFGTPTGLGNPDDFIVLTNHKKEYIDGFIGKGHYNSAPMTRWAIENEGYASWRMIDDLIQSGQASKEVIDAVEFNKCHDVTCGVTISFKAILYRSRGAIALTGSPDMTQDDVDKIWAAHKDELIMLNNVAHLKILSLPFTTMSGRRLTKRQREALEWVGDGKTSQDIAVLMGLTQATVEKHLRLARETLGVETTAQAVLKASFQNQMFRLEGI